MKTPRSRRKMISFAEEAVEEEDEDDDEFAPTNGKSSKTSQGRKPVDRDRNVFYVGEWQGHRRLSKKDAGLFVKAVWEQLLDHCHFIVSLIVVS